MKGGGGGGQKHCLELPASRRRRLIGVQHMVSRLPMAAPCLGDQRLSKSTSAFPACACGGILPAREDSSERPRRRCRRKEVACAVPRPHACAFVPGRVMRAPRAALHASSARVSSLPYVQLKCEGFSPRVRTHFIQRCRHFVSRPAIPPGDGDRDGFGVVASTCSPTATS